MTVPEFSTHLHPDVPPTGHEHHTVIIIGAGPTGLFLGLKLAREGIDVLVLEAEKGIMQSPRATTYVCFPHAYLLY
jgi:cation diffusion facilitator CzcD-associated flavoprotein CzcO